MQAEIIYNHLMSYDLETDWMPLSVNGSGYGDSQKSAKSLQISWSGVQGDLDGAINIYVSNNPDVKTLARSYTISTESNLNDSEMIMIYPGFNFIKIEYISNGISAGYLNAILIYS